jgi:hypothetical protein
MDDDRYRLVAVFAFYGVLASGLTTLAGVALGFVLPVQTGMVMVWLIAVALVALLFAVHSAANQMKKEAIAGTAGDDEFPTRNHLMVTYAITLLVWSGAVLVVLG